MNIEPKQNAPKPSAAATGSAWTTGKLMSRNSLLVCAIIEGAKAAGSPHLSFDFLWYAVIAFCLLTVRDLITPNDRTERRGTATLEPPKT